ncbi:bifunctional DNA primase/polymerase [Alicyclobacillus fodiniaquatilis]|uniref:Bifunctional DNA primase/polymerase n=1 Tax=Alicyclobacillus fodiniaquatilis TaxID=1661150 RepID=A0ABW4JHL7_9BACL
MIDHDNQPHQHYNADMGSISSGSKPTTLQMFSRLGWRIFPVNSTKADGECTCGRPECPNKGKHPRITSWPENATTDLIQLAKWQKQWPDTNWALACGQESGVWVLDVDEKNGGYESLAKLESEIGELPATVRVKTGGGGLHIYFAWPTDGTIITNAVNLKGDYPGLDVRGYRGYVVVPPGKHKSGNRYDWVEGLSPDDVSLAQAPQTLIEVIKNAGGSRAYSDKPRDTRPWEPVPNEIIREKAPALCARIDYFASEAGANDVSYEDWITMASWGHAMTDDETIFHEWSSVDKDRYSKRDTGRKWKDTADMAPRSCHRAQADHPLEQCKNCPLFELDKNPSYHVRMAYNQEQGGRGPWGAPPPTPEELEERRKIAEERRKQERGAYMDSLSSETEHDEQEQLHTYTVETDGATAVAPVIDVTEDDEEGSTTSYDAEEQTTAYQQPNFRIAADNITPLIEQSKALETRLRNGEDPHDLMQEVARVLAAIKKLDSIRYDVEKDRLISAEGDARKKGQRAKYTSKKLDDAVKAVAEREAAELLTKTSTVGEVWPDAPEEHHELPLPTGYKYSEDGVEKFVSTSQGNMGFEEVSSQPTYIAGWRKDITTSEIQAVIYTRTRDEGWKEITCAPSAFSDKRKIGEIKDIGCSFKEEQVFGKYLNEGYDLIRTRFGLEPELGTSRLGWHNVNDQIFFVFPEQSFGSMPIELHTNKQQLMSELSVKGDIVKEREALVETMFRYKKLAFAVGTAAASILMRPAKMSGIVDLFGFCSEYVSAQTGTGKSTTVGAAISIYGAPYSVRNFQMTQFAATQSMIVRSDLPNVWQEAQAGNQAGKGGNNADPGMLLHVLGDGGGKLMGTKGGGLRHNPQIFGTMLLANNENFVNPSTAKQGELQRVFTFDPPFPNPHDETRTKDDIQRVKKDQEKMMQELSNNHGNGGRAMVQKLIEITDGSWTKLCEKVEADYRVQYEASSKLIPADIENHSLFNRRAKIVALVRVGLKYLIEYGYSLPEGITGILFRGIDEAFEEFIKSQMSDIDAVETERYLPLFTDALIKQSNRIRYLEEIDVDTGKPKEPFDGEYIGTITEKDGVWHLAIQADVISSFFKAHQKPPRQILREWAKQKIITTEKSRLQCQVTMRKPSGVEYGGRLYCFRLDKLAITVPPGAYERYQLDFGVARKAQETDDL